jgi:hypothetical protein
MENNGSFEDRIFSYKNQKPAKLHNYAKLCNFFKTVRKISRNLTDYLVT